VDLAIALPSRRLLPALPPALALAEMPRLAPKNCNVYSWAGIGQVH